MQTPEDYQKAVADSYKQHITKKLRAAYPDIADANDDELLQVWHGLEVPDANPDEAEKVLEEMYGSDWKKPDPSLGLRAQQMGHVAAETGKGLARGVTEFAGAITAGNLIGKAAPMARKGLAKTAAAQLAMAIPTTIRMAGREKAGRSLEKTAAEMPEPNIEDLRARGYDNNQIHNIIKGYTDTQQSLMSDVEEMGKGGVEEAATGIANAAFLDPQAGWLKNIGATATSLASKAGAKVGLAELLGKTVGHSAGGALWGSAYGATHSAFTRGAEAAASGAKADEILSAATAGAMAGGKQGAKYGAILGGALGGTLEAAAVPMAQSAARKAAAATAVDNAMKASLLRFGENFNPSWLRERFSDDLRMANEQRLPDEELARIIVTNTQGPEAAATETGMRAISMVFEKIKNWRMINDGLAGPMLDLPIKPFGPEVIPNEALPPGAPVEPPIGGQAPMPNMPPALQGPMGQQFPGFVPPEGIPAEVASEGAPQQVPVPLELQGMAPEQGMLPTARLRQPLPVQSTAPAGVPEFAPRELGNPTLTPEAPFQNLALPRPPAPPLPEGYAQLEGNAVPNAVAKPQDVNNRIPGLVNAEPSMAMPENLPESVQGSIAIPDRPIVKTPVEQAASDITELADKFEGNEKVFGDVKIHVSPSDDGHAVKLNLIQNLGKQKGAAGKVLQQVIDKADEHNVPIVLDALPLANPIRGGKIPTDKLVSFYESYGFKKTGEKGVSENAIMMRREPKMFTDNPWVTFADKNIADAKARLNKRGIRLNTGIDPRDIGDMSIIGANYMLKGFVKLPEWTSSMVKEFGEAIRPHVKKIYQKAMKSYLETKKQQSSMTEALKKNGKVVTAAKAIGKTWDGASIWLTPEGQLIQSNTNHARSSADAVKAAKIKTKDVNYLGDYYWSIHALLQRGYIRLQANPKQVNVQMVSNPTSLQRRILGEMTKQRDSANPIQGVIMSYDGKDESELYTTLSDLLRAADEGGK